MKLQSNKLAWQTGAQKRAHSLISAFDTFANKCGRCAFARSIFAPIAVFVIVSGLYLMSMTRDIGFWDTGEMQTVPYILGLAHPNGFPTEILAGWLFTHIFAVGSPAVRMAIYSALVSAFSAAMCCVISRQLGAKAFLATICAVGFASAAVVWQHATRVDVLDPAVAFAALTMMLSIQSVRSNPAVPPWIVGISAGLALGTHAVVIFFVPVPAGIATLGRGVRNILPRLGQFVLAMVATGVAVYAYLPLRASMVEQLRLDPTDSLGFSGEPIWDWGSPTNPTRLWAVISGQSVSAGSTLRDLLNAHLIPAYVSFALRQAEASYPVAMLFFVFCLLAAAMVIHWKFLWRRILVLVLPAALVTPFAT